MTDAPRYRFSGFELDVESGELVGPGGQGRRLEPQPARVLAILIDRAGQLVTREALQREVWPETHVDFDQGINYCIRQIRTALGESAESPRFIETLPRRGYRFLAPVEPADRGTDTPGRRPVRRRRAVVGLALVLLAVLAAGWWLLERAPSPNARPATRVAVLPFHGVDARPSDWENRMTESLVVHLTGGGGRDLAVIGPATSAAAAAEGLAQGEVGRRLGVDLVLSGGLRSDGAGVFAQLIGAPSGEHLWATVLPQGEPDAVGREIAGAVLAALQERDASGN